MSRLPHVAEDQDRMLQEIEIVMPTWHPSNDPSDHIAWEQSETLGTNTFTVAAGDHTPQSSVRSALEGLRALAGRPLVFEVATSYGTTWWDMRQGSGSAPRAVLVPAVDDAYATHHVQWHATVRRTDANGNPRPFQTLRFVVKTRQAGFSQQDPQTGRQSIRIAVNGSWARATVANALLHHAPSSQRSLGVTHRIFRR